MTPLIVCACALLAVGFWIIYAICTAIHSLLDGVLETITNIGAAVLIALVSFGGLYFLLYLVTDYMSIIGFITGLLSNVIELILSLIMVGVIIGIVSYFVSTFGLLIFEIAVGIVGLIVSIIVGILEFVKDISERAFAFFIGVINSRIENV